MKTTYQQGQKWCYKTREGETASRVFIAKVDEHDKLGNIYHLYIDDIRLKNPYLESGVQDFLPHTPVSEKTLEKSLTTLENEAYTEEIDISEGYQEWREAFDNGKAGIYTISIAEIITIVEDTISTME